MKRELARMEAKARKAARAEAAKLKKEKVPPGSANRRLNWQAACPSGHRAAAVGAVLAAVLAAVRAALQQQRQQLLRYRQQQLGF